MARPSQSVTFVPGHSCDVTGFLTGSITLTTTITVSALQ